MFLFLLIFDPHRQDSRRSVGSPSVGSLFCAYHAITSIAQKLLSVKGFSSKIKNISNAISKSKLPDNVVVHRGLGEKGFQNWLGINPYKLDPEEMNKLKKSLVNSEVVEKGFMSTTAFSEVRPAFRGGVELELHLPKGTEALYVAPYSTWGKTEAEVLLQKNSKFVVDEVISNGRSVTKLIMHLVS